MAYRQLTHIRSALCESGFWARVEKRQEHARRSPGVALVKRGYEVVVVDADSTNVGLH